MHLRSCYQIKILFTERVFGEIYCVGRVGGHIFVAAHQSVYRHAQPEMTLPLIKIVDHERDLHIIQFDAIFANDSGTIVYRITITITFGALLAIKCLETECHMTIKPYVANAAKIGTYLMVTCIAIAIYLAEICPSYKSYRY